MHIRMGKHLAGMLSALLLALPVNAETGGKWRDPQTGMEFVRISGGCFDMGADQAGGRFPGSRTPPRGDEIPRHRVCVDGFWLGTHEVTREQWLRIMGPGRSPAPGLARRPMTHVTWEDAQVFVRRLNEKAAAGERFRLPTEAEWEFACQPGESKLSWDRNPNERLEELKAAAWFAEHLRSDPETRNVGEMSPNPLGLYDMLGNVWEWVEDVYLPDGYSRHAGKNPKVTAGSDRHVMRGGSFRSETFHVRCGARTYGVPNDPLPSVGLRLVRETAGNR